MNGSVHQAMTWRSKGMWIFPEQSCRQLIIALLYSNRILVHILYLCTKVCGNAMLFSIYQNHADNSRKMKSEHRNIRNRQHQRTVIKMALRPYIIFWERTAAVSLDVSDSVLKNILLSIDCNLPIDLLSHTVNAVSALH